MNKILIIFQKEYLTRVRNKTFIISTFLLPIIIVLFIVAIAYFSVHNSEKNTIAVNDTSGAFLNSLKSDSTQVNFVYDNDINANNFLQKGYTGVLMIPAQSGLRKDTIRLISEKQLALTSEEYIKTQLGAALQKKLFKEKNFDKAAVDSILETSVTIVYEFNAYQQKKEKYNNQIFGLLT